MANYKTIFFGTEQSKTDENSLQCYRNQNNEIYIEIAESHGPNSGFPSTICLDKTTAIKFAKTVRTHINQIED